MQPKPLAIGVFAKHTSGHYYGAMLSSIHQFTSAAGVPLLVIQGELQDLRLPPFGADYVAGWIVIHPSESNTLRVTTDHRIYRRPAVTARPANNQQIILLDKDAHTSAWYTTCSVNHS
jgi:hypothetical protein